MLTWISIFAFTSICMGIITSYTVGLHMVVCVTAEQLALLTLNAKKYNARKCAVLVDAHLVFGRVAARCGDLDGPGPSGAVKGPSRFSQ